MIKINHYEALNIPRDADKATIKRAYFSLVKIYTPEKEPDKFRTLREAYDTLSDDKRRAQYDKLFNGAEHLQNDLVSAREMIRQSKLKQAIEELTVLQQDNPDEVVVSRLLALAYTKNKNTGKAQKICESLLDKNPNDLETRLLLANVYAARGYVVKAQEQYEQLTKAHPEKKENWIAYVGFLLSEKSRGYSSHTLNEIMNKALQISDDMFKDEYELYMHCACAVSAPNSFFSFSMRETLRKNPDAARYFELFTRFFIDDKRPTLEIYDIAVKGLDFFVATRMSFPSEEKLLDVLLDSGHRQPHHDKTLNRMRNFLSIKRVKIDKRVQEELTDLLELIAKACDCDTCKYSQAVLEHNIVFDLPSSRRQVTVLRDHYPDLFKLNEAFFIDVLNKAKERSLQTKYHALANRLDKSETRGKTSYLPDMDLLDALEDYDSFGEDNWGFGSLPQPFVRESPKVGRNDPCPCGSGKKYKKCCGAAG